MDLFSNAVNTVKSWWWFTLKGLLLIAAGIAILLHPLEGYLGLSTLFNAIILGTGCVQIAFAINNRDTYRGWGWTLVSGIIDLALGAFLFIYPAVTIISLPYIVGFWLVFRAFYLMGASLDLRALQVAGWGWLFVGGLVLMLLSFMMLYRPVAGAASLVGFSSAAFILGGILNVGLSWQLHMIKNTVRTAL